MAVDLLYAMVGDDNLATIIVLEREVPGLERNDFIPAERLAVSWDTAVANLNSS